MAATSTSKNNAAQSPVPPKSSSWKEYTAGDRKYWYNKETKEKTWKNPKSPAKSTVTAAVVKPESAPLKHAPTPISQTVKEKATRAIATTAVGSEGTKATPSAPPLTPSASGKGKVPKLTHPPITSPNQPPTAKASTKIVTPEAALPPATSSVRLSAARSDTRVTAPQTTHPPNTTPAHVSKVRPAHAPTASPAYPSPPSPAAESSRDIDAVVDGHGNVPNEHVTVQVKSKKKNWMDALDVGLKVLDSAMERAKKGDNIRKNADPSVPGIKGPIAPDTHHGDSVKVLKEAPHAASRVEGQPTRSHVSSASNTHSSKDLPPHAAVNEAARPKATSKLSWKSPFKKHAAAQSPTVPSEANRDIGVNDEISNDLGSAPSSYAAAVAAPATTSSQSPPSLLQAAAAPSLAFRGIAGSQSDDESGKDTAGKSSGQKRTSQGGQAGAAAPIQKSNVGQGASATGAAVLGSTAGYGAYNEYEQGTSGDESAPPSPPPEQDDSSPPTPRGELDDSAPPSPPVESDKSASPSLVGEAYEHSQYELPSPVNTSGPPSPPADDDDTGYTTYAFEQPPSPALSQSLQAADDASSPPSPPDSPIPSPPSPGQSPSPSRTSPAPEADDEADPPSPPVSASPGPDSRARSPSPPAPVSPAPEADDDQSPPSPMPSSSPTRTASLSGTMSPARTTSPPPALSAKPGSTNGDDSDSD